MKMYDIIEKKKNKLSLSLEEIKFVIDGYCNNTIPDYQMSSLLMAIVLNGMNEEETFYLTKVMTESGDRIELSCFNNTVDKHSTGGVGDKTTLIIAPIVACLGCKVAKMSGKGLGYTGGTIDKLESIGIKTQLSNEQFMNQVNNINIALISQTVNIAPADKKIYALRDVTATVESIPLIAASIMSKKIASGAKNLVLDVKVGSGAFMKDEIAAKELASLMVKIGNMCNINTCAVLTDMNQPLGNYVGNLLEVYEALEVLKGNIENDLKKLCIELATYMVSLATKIEINEARNKVIEVLNNGSAYNKLLELIRYQGGDLELLNNKSKYEYNVYSNKTGYIVSMNTEEIGKISCELGSGRINKDDVIDYTAGIKINYKIGDYIKEGDILCTLYTNKQIDLTNDYLNCIKIENYPIEKVKIVKEIIK